MGVIKKQLRIVTDKYCGYEAQWRPSLLGKVPLWFWSQIGGVNTRHTPEASLEYARKALKKEIHREFLDD